jgi:fumarate reductase subunit C
MAVNTTTYVRSSSRTSAYLDWLQMLTGAALILFMWSHMILVASVNLGAGVMNALAHFLEATYMAQVGGPIIACIFLSLSGSSADSFVIPTPISGSSRP